MSAVAAPFFVRRPHGACSIARAFSAVVRASQRIQRGDRRNLRPCRPQDRSATRAMGRWGACRLGRSGPSRRRSPPCAPGTDRYGDRRNAAGSVAGRVDGGGQHRHEACDRPETRCPECAHRQGRSMVPGGQGQAAAVRCRRGRYSAYARSGPPFPSGGCPRAPTSRLPKVWSKSGPSVARPE